MPKVFTSKTQKTGEIGEHVAVRYFEGKGYKILERNFTRKCGEIDIVVQKGGLVHFVEVKSEVADLAKKDIDSYKPEENMHPWKLKRLSRVIQVYLLEKNIVNEWQVDLAVVRLEPNLEKAMVRVIENIII